MRPSSVVVNSQGAGNDEYNPGKPMDDSFDPFHAARAWFTYAQVVLPPPKRMTPTPLSTA